MKNLLIFTIAFTIVTNSFAETPSCNSIKEELAASQGVIASCGAYVKTLTIQGTAKDNEIAGLKDIHTQDANQLSKDASSMSPLLVFLLGAGAAFAVYGIASAIHR
jgi:hypothetical protein